MLLVLLVLRLLRWRSVSRGQREQQFHVRFVRPEAECRHRVPATAQSMLQRRLGRFTPVTQVNTTHNTTIHNTSKHSTLEHM